MERALATIRKIAKIRPIRGADAIELAIIDGWQVVVKKGEFNPGDYCVYFEIDSFLPIQERYEFLRSKSSLKRMADATEGFRLKTIKFRGELSQGLALPISKFPELDIPSTFVSNIDVTKKLGVRKYEAPVPACLNGEALRTMPEFLHTTDEERIQNLSDYFNRFPTRVCGTKMLFEATEKLDGSSMTVYYNHGEHGVCSRNIDLKETKNNSYWKVAKATGIYEELKNFCKASKTNYAVQGELCGEGIQNNPLRLFGQHLFVFNIWNIDEQRYLLPTERKVVYSKLAKNTKIKHVPILSEDLPVFDIFASVEDLVKYADGASAVTPGVIREGIVFKCLTSKSGGLLSFKAISNQYLLREK